MFRQDLAFFGQRVANGVSSQSPHHPGRSAQTLGNGRLRLYTLVRARMLASACRLRHTARHLGGAARRFAAAAPTATSDGDGGSGGDPSQALSVTDTNNGIEYFNPPNSTTPFSRVVRAGGMVYGTAPLAAGCYPSTPHCPWLAAALQCPALARAAGRTARRGSGRRRRRQSGLSRTSSRSWSRPAAAWT